MHHQHHRAGLPCPGEQRPPPPPAVTAAAALSCPSLAPGPRRRPADAWGSHCPSGAQLKVHGEALHPRHPPSPPPSPPACPLCCAEHAAVPTLDRRRADAGGVLRQPPARAALALRLGAAQVRLHAHVLGAALWGRLLLATRPQVRRQRVWRCPLLAGSGGAVCCAVLCCLMAWITAC